MVTSPNVIHLAACLTLALSPACSGKSSSPPSAPTLVRSGAVVLPGGTTASLTSLRVATSLDQVGVAADGAFAVKAFQGGPQLAMAVDGAGNAVLLGFVGAGGATLDVRSTSAALTYLACGVPAHASATQARALELLASDPALAPLDQALATGMAADLAALSKGTAAIRTALSTVVAALCGVPATSLQSSRPPPWMLVVDPTGDQSGVRLDILGAAINTFHPVNKLRRAGYLYVDQASYVDESGASHDQGAAVTEFDLPPTTGLNGTLGTFVDIFNGNMAYAEVAGQDVALENLAPRRSTTYRVTLVGPSLLDRPGAWSQLSTAQRAKQSSMMALFVARDLVVPLFASVIVPAVGAIQSGFDAETIRSDLQALPVFADFVYQMNALPAVSTASQAGDVRTAVQVAVVNVLQGGTLQGPLYRLFESYFRAKVGDSYRTFETLERAKAVLNAVAITNILLATGDLTTVTAHVAQSNAADVWTVVATTPKAVMEPRAVTVPIFGRTTLKAVVSELAGAGSGSGPAPTLSYHWRNSGAVGSISDGLHAAAEFDSSSDSVTYEADLGKTGNDTVTCKVTWVQSTDAGTRRVEVGTATAAVTVSPASADCTTLASGCCCFVPQHVLDLGSQFDAGQAMTITWQPGTPGSRCGGGTMSFAVSADAGSWTPMGSAAFPSISGQSYPRRTTDVSAPAPFRYVKVWPDACYVDYSSVVLR